MLKNCVQFSQPLLEDPPNSCAGQPPALGHTAAVLAEPDGVALPLLDALSIGDGLARASQVAALGYGCCLYWRRVWKGESSE